MDLSGGLVRCRFLVILCRSAFKVLLSVEYESSFDESCKQKINHRKCQVDTKWISHESMFAMLYGINRMFACDRLFVCANINLIRCGTPEEENSSERAFLSPEKKLIREKRGLPSSSRWCEFRRHWWQRCRFSAPWLSRYSQTTHNTSANEIERAEFSNCSSAAQLNNQINYAKLARWIQIFIEVFLCNSKAHLLHHVFPRHSERVESLSEQVFAIFSRLAGQKRDFHIHRPRDVAVLNFLSIHS